MVASEISPYENIFPSQGDTIELGLFASSMTQAPSFSSLVKKSLKHQKEVISSFTSSRFA